ncbi:Protein of unknown function DUF1639 [Dillenia turbinata]|uniref:Uncharacterized protein n=1 Tax=Dillenia turbinata TaxID=194707 RepID=A0AAN8UXF1_9MAGN
MSAAPTHSKPLHNFSFPEPQWNTSSNGNASNAVNNEGQNHYSYSRRVGGSNSEQKGPERRQHEEEEVVAMERPESETPKTDSSSENVQEAKSPATETPKPASAKILIRLKTKVPKPTEDCSIAAAVKEVKEKEKENEEKEGEESEQQKTWNFRPRRASRAKRTHGEAPMTRATGLPEDSKTPVSQRPAKNRSEGKSADKKEKEKVRFDFSLTLTREEIEEDLFLMTGSRPSRKPKRRPKSVQNRLDNLAPGSWLHTITPDSYKVYSNSRKINLVSACCTFRMDIIFPSEDQKKLRSDFCCSHLKVWLLLSSVEAGRLQDLILIVKPSHPQSLDCLPKFRLSLTLNEEKEERKSAPDYLYC